MKRSSPRNPCEWHPDFNRRFREATNHGVLAFPDFGYNSVKQVLKARNLGHGLALRCRHNFHRSAFSQDPSLFKRYGALPQSKNLLMVVGDVKHGDAVRLIPDT